MIEQKPMPVNREVRRYYIARNRDFERVMSPIEEPDKRFIKIPEDEWVRAIDYDALRARVSELEAAGRAVLNCNDQVCAFGHGGCPAQCRADEMLRKAIRCAGNKTAP